MTTRDDMVSLLKDNVVQVSFTKKDGTNRIMKCTLEPGILPENKPSEAERKVNDSVINAFNVDLMEWRSFRVDSVKYFQYDKIDQGGNPLSFTTTFKQVHMNEVNETEAENATSA